ncbi:hypothetical protein NQ314_011927 [Rhamnusium bicolor]|uniref:acid phosphatase n=1 Tax=Rhamnusium bicolor TaxID=1586634 RepID=A0AAV8XFZ5_9CUCU|nr:hypothetical protein NQ314_011927 [Rhamnusium bicolor]
MLRRPNSYCPTYLSELEKVFQSEEVAIYLKKNKKILEYIAESTGKPINKLLDVFGIFQTLTAERWMNLTLPEWSKSVFPEEITELAAKQCELENSNGILKKLNGGRSLKKVIENMVAKSTHSLYPHVRKIFLYSGHENNVINILSALNLFKVHFPNYSSAVMIELHYLEEKDQYAVKVLYSKDVNVDPEEQQLEGCDVLCPLDKFIEISQPHIPVNYTAECGSQVYLD